MMMSFSLPGLPSAFNLRIPLLSCALEACALASEGSTVAVIPSAESMEAKRKANILRVNAKFIKAPFNTEFESQLLLQRNSGASRPQHQTTILPRLASLVRFSITSE
jgi:hypothetical protein